jgi:hypothetical protein
MTSPQHDSAVQRLNAGHVEQERLRVRYRAAIGTSAEMSSYCQLRAAGDEVATRVTWLRWIDDESYRGLNAGPFELLAEQAPESPQYASGANEEVDDSPRRRSQRL